MSSPIQADEDEVEEVEFVSMEDEIACQKRHVTSTLDKLALQVAQEKKEKANKCRAFKEKQILQRAHGEQELSVSSINGASREAKRCVDMWLKMPGTKPGVITTGFGIRRRSAPVPRESETTHTCPVINCGRVYDNGALLGGHLKRFDHSPCDPTIHLKGSPSELFACAACGQHFQTKDAWKRHMESKLSSSNPGSHRINQTYQRILCFACPACYLLFSLRDECLQHMAAKNHFTESLPMSETKGRAVPVPIPQHVKNRLIALCKDTAFNVRCSRCFKVLASHQVAQAHFNVNCRQGCAVAKADKTIAQVMKQLQVQGQCSLCSKIFLNQAEMEQHKESTQHDVEVNHTMEKAVLQHFRFIEIQHTQRAEDSRETPQSSGPETPFQKRNRKRMFCEESPSKRQKLTPMMNGSTVTAWCCECGLQFLEEASATKHLLAVNQIFHQCGVCGKRMGESSITRLHMSRFHGGAHLSNFLFYCRKCKVEMPRYQDILSHVSEAHSGHTYYTEQDVPEELAAAMDAKPSTSSKVTLHSASTVEHNTVEASSSRAEQTWMCRMCEDTFDSEADVHKHCSDMNSHSYQRFICGHCPQKFFKESTVRRHCMNEHGGELKSFHFCGLCDSMQFDSEGEFLQHYKSLHSQDYHCMSDAEDVQPAAEDVQPAAAAESTSNLTCPCMGSEISKEARKATYTQCMRNLSAEGRCRFVCEPCDVSVPSYAQMKTHIHTRHPALHLDNTFDIQCLTCHVTFMDVPNFHKHYHSKHCTLEPCRTTSSTCSKDTKAKPTAVQICNAVKIKPNNTGIKDVEVEVQENIINLDQANEETERHESDSEEEMNHSPSVSTEARESAELEEALKRSLLEF
ncbi:E3 SUMO-protein ligase ZNF451 isoform X2 [Notolabrus celidotus]|uniref:E3 SUMO-protein ligase ZNF451 isoform X2 n=1 Tax=Notolabrus celidotus TaxID=1203425 RepID=UPI00148F8069|nr:E3 SUMO-protein ligase ZNF451 isoform X2 [Notolabrus celidotus]XP_034537785.1 E3 SUMO-protein ligase ZNF451 isoform X2 [Notolabrus celidotus]